MMPKSRDEFPSREHVISYLKEYEEKYDLNMLRPVKATSIEHINGLVTVKTSKGDYKTKAVIFATGNWSNKYIPEYKDYNVYEGIKLHSGDYKSYHPFISKKVLVIGGGNSGAQIAAELSLYSECIWITLKEPEFLPEDIDGRALFDYASSRYRKIQNGNTAKTPSLGDIVQVPDVKKALDDNRFDIRRPFKRFTTTGVEWEDDTEEDFDAVIWCTGFKPELRVISSFLGMDPSTEKLKLNGTKLNDENPVWLVGYGNWTGFASATLIGVGRTAKRTVEEIKQYLGSI
jgi:NADPH-dependent glutamate synthase beta subunit-like oxidoreductase